MGDLDRCPLHVSSRSPSRASCHPASPPKHSVEDCTLQVLPYSRFSPELRDQHPPSQKMSLKFARCRPFPCTIIVPSRLLFFIRGRRVIIYIIPLSRAWVLNNPRKGSNRRLLLDGLCISPIGSELHPHGLDLIPVRNTADFGLVWAYGPTQSSAEMTHIPGLPPNEVPKLATRSRVHSVVINKVGLTNSSTSADEWAAKFYIGGKLPRSGHSSQMLGIITWCNMAHLKIRPPF